MEQKQIKLMPDYQCWPLWWAGTHPPGNIDPYTLPLSVETSKRLIAWAQMFDAQLHWDDPGSTTWTEEFLQKFEQEGFDLWKELTSELAGEFKILYFSISQNQLLE